MPRKNKDKYPGQVPMWGPSPVDTDVETVNPLPGWVVLKEVFANQEKAVAGTDVVITIVRPYVNNTVYGEVLRAHPDTQEEYGIDLGDLVVFKEYSGGRWLFGNVKTLITPAKDILAKA